MPFRIDGLADMPQSNSTPVKKPRRDGQVSGLAGELFVAAELLKRGLQTSVTFGNAKGVDLFARHPETKATFVVQVKTLRENNYWLLSPSKVDPSHVYVFVLLNKPGQAVRYFVVAGQQLKDEPERFGKGFADPKLPGILPRTLATAGHEDVGDLRSCRGLTYAIDWRPLQAIASWPTKGR